MSRHPVAPDSDSKGLPDRSPGALAILLGTIAVALGALISFGYLMLRSGGSNVGELPAFAAAVTIIESSGPVELWRGIPRPAPQAERDAAMQRAVGAFEPTPIQPGADDAQWLRAYCSAESHFREMDPNVQKLCDGFHADWSVVFAAGARTAEFALCFGCDEVKILVNGNEPLHLDLVGSVTLRPFFERFSAR